MYTRRIKVTWDNIDKIREYFDDHLVSLTLLLELEDIKKYAPKIGN